MSCITCCLPILECVYCLACARWAWKRCRYTAGHESRNWGVSSAEEFQPIPRICRYILSVYEDDLRNPVWAPPGGYQMNPDWVVLRKDYDDTGGQVTPYIVYLDHDNADVVLVVRGLTMGRESDRAILLDNQLGMAPFDGGYVHNGLLKAAMWVFDTERELLRDLLEKNPTYTLTFAGHSLGAGVVALLTLVALQDREILGNVDRKRVRCYAMAPPRCVSLNLAVRYADVVNSVVLQDDFLPRTTATLEAVFKSLIWFQRLPPSVRTAVPVDGRFEHIVISCNAISDHGVMEIPPNQRMERQEKLAREHGEEYREALRRAAALDVPHSYVPSPYGTFNTVETGVRLSTRSPGEDSLAASRWRDSWDDFIGRLFEKDESGHMAFKK
ncbi:hypothetical protein KSS87_010454 [Heliosperma pusillum]|nr:hypothetical protein KSS87_010454 [Heliosperma pusillum]